MAVEALGTLVLKDSVAEKGEICIIFPPSGCVSAIHVAPGIVAQRSPARVALFNENIYWPLTHYDIMRFYVCLFRMKLIWELLGPEDL